MAQLPSTLSIHSLQRNRLLRKLGPGDLALLTPGLMQVPLARRQLIEEPNKPFKHVYFVEDGFVSVVATAAGGKQTEVGLIGSEGMTGMTVVLGDHRSPHAAYVQLEGGAQRIEVVALRHAMDESATLRGLLMKFAQVFMIQAAQTAVANARGKLEERLARWLLMAHDRVPGAGIPLTHEFLSMMLAVRRAGVTVALHGLQERGLIRAGRRAIEVLDRRGLEKLAGGLYGVPEAEFKRLIG